MIPLVRLSMLVAALVLSSSAAPALTHHEATDGDLPGTSAFGGDPPVLELDLGTNQVVGSQRIIEDLEEDLDAFRIQLPSKAFLSSVSVTFENEIIGHSAAELFMDYRLILSPPSFTPNVLSTTSGRDGDTATVPLFEGELPTTLGALHEIYLDGYTA